MSNNITPEDIYQIFQRVQEETRAAESKSEADSRTVELQKLVASTNAAVNSLFSRWELFVENLVDNAAVQLFKERGIDVKEIHQQMKVRRGEIGMGIDIFDTALVFQFWILDFRFWIGD